GVVSALLKGGRAIFIGDTSDGRWHAIGRGVHSSAVGQHGATRAYVLGEHEEEFFCPRQHDADPRRAHAWIGPRHPDSWPWRGGAWCDGQLSVAIPCARSRVAEQLTGGPHLVVACGRLAG